MIPSDVSFRFGLNLGSVSKESKEKKDRTKDTLPDWTGCLGALRGDAGGSSAIQTLS